MKDNTIIVGLDIGTTKITTVIGEVAAGGVHIIGEGASELIHIGQAVMTFGGTVQHFVESVFNWPGLGSYTVKSIQSLDIPAILGVTLFVAVLYVVLNLAVDVVQALIDPRVRS